MTKNKCFSYYKLIYKNKKIMSLIFFNNEGNAYNFEINSDGVYEGKLIFDENSSDTFKTLGIYVFEEVEAFDILDDFKFNNIELYNNSGVTFQSATYKNQTITNIKKSNTSASFYSKWVYGDNFDIKFPIGTIVSFSGVTNADFQEDYYSVVDVKKNAIMILTPTNNNIWNYTFADISTVTSYNCVFLNDYDNTMIPSWLLHTIHDNKKINFVGTTSNDGVQVLNDSKSLYTFYEQFDCSNLYSGYTNLNISIELKTDRPKMYQGEVTFKLLNNTALLTFTKAYDSLLKEGDEIIVEDYYGNPLISANPIMTIEEGIYYDNIFNGPIKIVKEVNTNKSYIKHFNKSDISSRIFINTVSPTIFDQDQQLQINLKPLNFFVYDYYLEFSGDSITLLDLAIDDTIKLEGGTTTAKNKDRELTVTKIETFKDIRITYWKNQLKKPVLYDNIKRKSIINTNTQYDELYNEALNLYNTRDNNPESPYYIPVIERINKIYVKEYIIPETNNYLIKEILNKKSNKLSCSMTYTSTFEQNITKNVIIYKTTNILTFQQNVIKLENTDSGDTTINKTISAFNIKYKDYLLDRYGILLYANGDDLIIHSTRCLNDLSYSKYFNSIVSMDNIICTKTTNNINTLLLDFDTQLINETIYPNELDKFNINTNLEIEFDLNQSDTNFGFNVEINDIDFYTPFDTDTNNTIINFISLHENSFLNLGLIVDVSGDTLLIYSNTPKVDIYSVLVKVNSFSTYEIINYNRSKLLILSGNEIQLLNSYKTLEDYGLSTGMIITIDESLYDNNKSYNIVGMDLSTKIIDLSYQGTFYNDENFVLVSVDSFIRKPREKKQRDIYYKWRFAEPFSSDIFFYDFSGNHLIPYLNDNRLAYNGVKPLWSDDCNSEKITLIDQPNKSVKYISDPTMQQTRFNGLDGEYCLSFLVDKYNSLTEYDYIPEPMQIFLGFNSLDEGVSQTTVYMDKVEDIEFSGYTNSTNIPNNINFNLSNYDITYFSSDVNFNFNDYGFSEGQIITINIIDQSETEQRIFDQYGNIVIKSVSNNIIRTDTLFSPFNTFSNTKGFYYEIIVQPKPILKLSIYGETEIEDERFRIVLNNLGIQINEEDEHIFKESDINEHGVDYIRLNQKRKEMLLVFPEIYNYIGSYKALINSINYFGWNDLKLYEYYKNINNKSQLYNKLHKVLINNIFDNTIDGWTEDESVKNNSSYRKTNLFNLSYEITDENGNHVLLYSLDDVQIKLEKLKRWLRRNVLPLSSNIIDITGESHTKSDMILKVDVSDVMTNIISENDAMCVNFTFSQTLSFEDEYLFQVNFYTRSQLYPGYWTAKIKTFSKSGDKLIPQKYYKLSKNDLEPFSFNININIDQYIYIETCAYNDFGVAQIYNEMNNISTSKKYLLVNNNFHIPDYEYLNINQEYYWFDDMGYIYLSD
jgi:hypothetical protein